jgi:hypothetical protein
MELHLRLYRERLWHFESKERLVIISVHHRVHNLQTFKHNYGSVSWLHHAPHIIRIRPLILMLSNIMPFRQSLHRAVEYCLWYYGQILDVRYKICGFLMYDERTSVTYNAVYVRCLWREINITSNTLCLMWMNILSIPASLLWMKSGWVSLLGKFVYCVWR